MRRARPSDARLGQLRAKVVAGNRLSSEESLDWVFYDHPRDREDHVVFEGAPIDDIVAAWCSRAEAMRSAGELIVDRAIDRYRGADEPSASPLQYRPRASLGPPSKRPPELAATLDAFRARLSSAYFGAIVTLAELEEQDPLLWAQSVAEMVAGQR